MNRLGLLIALGLAVGVGVVFALWPDLDLRISALFASAGGTAFGLRYAPPLELLRQLGTWIVVVVAAVPIIALLLKLAFPHRPLLIGGRAIILMLSTLILLPGLLVNVALKDHWHRPRPVEVREFGGPEKFVAWWDPRGTCQRNCSFAAGEPSSAFWTLAAAAVAPPPWRALAYAGALLFGAASGLLRIAFGGHFFSDVFFAGVFVYLGIWLVHGWLYRWPATWLTDERIDGALERAIVGARQRLWPMSEGKR